MQPIKIPADITKASNDYVNYKYKEAKGNAPIVNTDRACYASMMPTLPDLSIDLYSHNTKASRLPNEHYLEWISLCKTNNLIPIESEFSVDAEGIQHLNISYNKYDKHLVYAALCCYRFADAFAPMVWQIVEHLKASKEFTFWQALHYGLGKHYTYGSGHSFSFICSSTSSYANWCQLDLCQSIAIKKFYALTIEERSKKTGYTNDCVSEVASKIGGAASSLDPYGRPSKKASNLMIANLEELLTDKFTQLYLMEDNLKNEYNRIIEEYKTRSAA